MESGLVFRRAEPKDVNRIWDMLHASSMAWTDQRILAHLSQIHVLVKAQTLLGVLLEDPGKTAVQWTAIHPLYPEKDLNVLMLKCFCSCRFVEDKQDRRVFSRFKEVSV